MVIKMRSINSISFGAVAFCIIFWVMISSGYAVPNIISYQGKLNDSTGQPLSGSYTITFTIYDALEGGTALWAETWTGVKKINVVNGLFNVELGVIEPFSPIMFDKDELYLGVKVELDNEMIPRQRFLSGTFAFSIEERQIHAYSHDMWSAYPDASGWAPLFQVTVPVGKIWIIHSAWLWLEADSGNYFTDINLRVNGEDKTVAAKGGGYGCNSNYTSPASGLNSFYRPGIKAYPGDTIAVVGLTSGSMSNKTMKAGFYYDEIIP